MQLICYNLRRIITHKYAAIAGRVGNEATHEKQKQQRDMASERTTYIFNQQTV